MGVVTRARNLLSRLEICQYEKKNTNLAVQVQKVKSKEAHPNLDILHFNVFALSSTELLERHEFIRCTINGDSLCVKDK